MIMINVRTKVVRQLIRYILIFLLFYPFIVFSRNNITDSIKQKISTCSEQEKILLLQDLSIHYSKSYMDSALFFAQEAYALSQKLADVENEIICLNLIGDYYGVVGKTYNSEETMQLALNLAKQSNDHYGLINTYIKRGEYYSARYNYNNELEMLDSAWFFVNKYNIIEQTPLVLNYIGNLYYKIKEYSQAKYYADLVSLFLDKMPNSENRISNLILKARLSFVDKEYSKSLMYFKQALKTSQQIGDMYMEQMTYRHIAGYYIDVNDYPVADKYIDSAIVICEKMNYTIQQSTLLTYKAHIDWLKSDYKSTLEYNKKALSLRKESKHIFAICSSLFNIGGNYTLLGEYDSAKYYINKGLEIAASEHNHSQLSRGYGKLSELNEKMGDYKEALKNNNLYNAYLDSVLSIKSSEKILLYSNLYQSEREKRLLENYELERKNKNILLLSLFIIVAITLILMLFRLNYIRKKSVAEIVKLSKVIQTTKQAVAIIETTGRLLYVNKGLINMLGYNDFDYLLENDIYHFMGENEKQRIKTTILPVMIEKGEWFGEIVLTKNGGRSFVAELTASMIKEKGKNDMFVVLFNDISIRKKQELEIRESRESLRKTVNTQDKMFSIIAHDLIGPFNSIIGFSKILSKDFNKYSDNELKRFAGIIEISTKSIFDLLSNLLHWSRSQLGKIEVIKEKTNVMSVVKENIGIYDQTLLKKDIKVIDNISEDLEVMVDASTFSIVIRNLISNAIKFTKSGGEITITAIKEAGSSIIKVADTGVGMEKEKVDALFKNTFNESQPGTDNEKGTGLGLSLCYELVNLNGGTLEVDSEVGKGTVFTIKLKD